MPAAADFADTLADAIDRLENPACVGIDPMPDRFPAAIAGSDLERTRAFCFAVIDAVAGVVPAVKPQSAMFERHGPEGVALLENVCHRARDAGLIVVLDAKRGDIGSTAAHYAAAAVRTRAHAITVNAYLGLSGIEPFLDAGLGVYALVRTSNPDSDAIQAKRLQGGATVAEHIAALLHDLGAKHIGKRGTSAVGAVVGATKAAGDGQALRAAMPNTPFLIPGVGAQGGTADDVRPLLRSASNASTPGERAVLVNASRSVLYGDDTPDWPQAIHDRAEHFAQTLKACLTA
jgi:orotidine-5'-phosphate decarboxylase